MKKQTQRIWYHGTNKHNAKSILKHGFREGTYFAAHLEDATGYGGEYVFEVILNIDCDNWQVCLSNPTPASQIRRLKRYHMKLIKEYPLLRVTEQP